MLDFLLMLFAGFVLVVLLSPVMLFLIYLSVFLFAPLFLFFMYCVIGLPWYLTRKLIRSFRKPSHSPK